MVIASLNLYDSSYGDNHEMGIQLSNLKEEDKEAFRDAQAEAAFIIAEVRPKTTRAEIKSKSNQPRRGQTDKEESVGTSILKGISGLFGIDEKGYCIRCSARIDFNREAPYCPECYKIWAKFKKADYEEVVCHSCGKEAKTSMNKPLCPSYYKKRK
jgi:hypothetical protein